MQKNRLVALLLSTIFFLLVGTGSAFALSVTELFKTDGSVNFLEDDDIEWLNVDSNGDGILDEGDSLRGVIQLQSLNGSNIDAGSAITDEGLSGLFEVTVLSKTAAAGGLYDYTFGATTGADGLSAGAVLAVYLDDTPPNPFPGSGAATTDALEAMFTDGTLLYEFGFAGDADEYWLAQSVDEDPSSAKTNTAFGGTFNVALSVITNNFLPVVQSSFTDVADASGLYAGRPAGDDMIDLFGGGGLGTTDPDLIGGTTPGDVRSDGDFFFATVPEPTTLLLFGFGLLGIAGAGRRKG